MLNPYPMPIAIYLVATWWLYSLSPSLVNTRAKPKSAIFNCPVELISKLAGFRSWNDKARIWKHLRSSGRTRMHSINGSNNKVWYSWEKEAILWSNVTMPHPVHNRVGMTESHPLEQHQHVAFHLGFSKRLFRVADHLGQIRQHILKYQHKPCAMRENVFQLHHLKERS